MALYIVSDQWYKERTDDSKKEAQKVMIAAAKLVREEIRVRSYNKDVYLGMNEIKSSEECQEFLTPTLRVFLDILIKDELKRDGIGQAITQAARPNSVISPLLFGIGIELHHVFGSKWLIKELSSLGFSITYNEVQLFKQSILQQQTLQSLSLPPFPTLGQFIADNADSNIRTLDETGTFHGMGIIDWYPRRNSQQITDQHVKCMTIHDAMTARSQKKIRTSKQHVDPSSARKDCDLADLDKLLDWFHDNNPFLCTSDDLHSLSTGLTAEKGDAINCDIAEEVGSKLQSKMDSVRYNGAIIKRSEQIKTLQDLQPGVRVG